MKLNLKKEGTDIIKLSSFGDTGTNKRQLEKSTVYIEAQSGTKIPIEVLIVPTIAVPLKNYVRYIDRNTSYLKGLKLAHPVTQDDTFEISLLIGADFFWEIVEDDVIRGNGPTAVKSKLGYLLSGPLKSGNRNLSTESNVFNVLVSHKVEEYDLESFWKLESIGIEPPKANDDESNYLTSYQKTSIELRENKYFAKLPWKPECGELPSNYCVTKRRTENVIKRLRQDPDMLQKYGEIIMEQERRGFIERVDENEQTTNAIHYIPHHPVKKDSSTTPIRIVYDCSCRMSPQHNSLNDCLNSNPPELNDLTKLLIRFRLKPYAITTDIEKAFLHVGLHEDDRNVTRFLWLSDPKDPDSALITYRFKSVLFGATCSPFILSATLLKHLQQSDNTISKMLERDLYVDNILSSVNGENEALEYFREARNLMNKARFNLRSWTSNSKEVRQQAAAENVLDTDKQTKVLGMRWNSVMDELLYPHRNIVSNASQLVTKREILKHSSRIYDPLGLLSPITIRAKVLLQDLWREKFDWDEPLNNEICKTWIKLARDIEDATKTVIPRYYFSKNTQNTNKTLHIFVDASTKAYGAEAYLCNGNDSSIVMAKSRVAPLKELTLPLLELMAAVIGARLAHHVQSTLNCTDINLWSDSQIVLHWLKSTKTLKRFVSNRIKEIKDLTDKHEWKYCLTSFNPADLLTRGITNEQYKDNLLWKKGPFWLTDMSKCPNMENSNENSLSILYNSSEIYQTYEASSIDKIESSIKPEGIHTIMDIDRHGSYRKLLRITAYVQRFIENCRTDRNSWKTGVLKSNELQRATELWIKSCQETIYAEEYKALQSREKFKNKTPRIRQLGLFLDGNNLIRCQGRIHNAPLPESTKFPYLLPPNHKLSTLIVMDVHEQILHSGVNMTTTQLRQTFWIPTMRQLVRKILGKCVVCRKVIGKPYTAPESPPLPTFRLQEAPPFTATGIDFTGALHVRDKNKQLSKAYICLFTCAATRAIHLEVVSNLTEETFLLAFRRFASRKSLPRFILTDNASTFISASEEVKRLCKSEKLQEIFSSQGIDWRFIPKRAPWFGGWWERLVGLTKNCLKKTLGRSLIDIESLETVAVEIEAILNDRPLTYVSSDLQDPEPLTPAHLLYGRRINTLPYPQTENIDIDNLYLTDIPYVNKREKRQSLLIQQFWNRWKFEYLTSLREFHHKTGGRPKIEIGDVVQIHDEKPRSRWKTAVVEELVRGNDGHTRSAVLRTNTGTTTRPIVKLYPLEIRMYTEEDKPEDTMTTDDQRRQTLPERKSAQRARENIRKWTM